jgi:phosphatidylglycerophosphate synthase
LNPPRVAIESEGPTPLASFVKARDSWVDVLVLERFAVPITRVCARARISPTTVSSVSIALRLTAAALFYRHDLRIAAVVYLGGLLLDGVDGKLARLTGRTSEFGRLLDYSSDFGVFVLLIFAVARGSGTPLIIATVCAATGVSSAFATAGSAADDRTAKNRGNDSKWEAFTRRHRLIAFPGVVEAHFVLFGLAPLIAGAVVEYGLVACSFYFALAWVAKLLAAHRREAN